MLAINVNDQLKAILTSETHFLLSVTPALVCFRDAQYSVGFSSVRLVAPSSVLIRDVRCPFSSLRHNSLYQFAPTPLHSPGVVSISVSTLSACLRLLHRLYHLLSVSVSITISKIYVDDCSAWLCLRRLCCLRLPLSPPSPSPPSGNIPGESGARTRNARPAAAGASGGVRPSHAPELRGGGTTAYTRQQTYLSSQPHYRHRVYRRVLNKHPVTDNKKRSYTDDVFFLSARHVSNAVLSPTLFQASCLKMITFKLP